MNRTDLQLSLGVLNLVCLVVVLVGYSIEFRGAIQMIGTACLFVTIGAQIGVKLAYRCRG